MYSNTKRLDVVRGTIYIQNCSEQYQIEKNLGTIIVQGVGNTVHIKDNIGRIVINGMQNLIKISGQTSGTVTDNGMQNTVQSISTSAYGQVSQRTQNWSQAHGSSFGQARTGMVSMQIGSGGSHTSQTISINYSGNGSSNIRMSSQQSGPHGRHQTITVQASNAEEEDWQDADEFDDSDEDEDEFEDEDDLEEYYDEDEESEEALAPLQVQPFARTTKSIPDTCVICMENFNRNHPDASFLECQHWFHKNCVARWMQDNRSCPQCKFETNVLFANGGS